MLGPFVLYSMAHKEDFNVRPVWQGRLINPLQGLFIACWKGQLIQLHTMAALGKNISNI